MLRLHVVLEADESGGFVISCPAFPGCISQGETEEESIENFKDALIGWLEVYDQLAAEKAGCVTKELSFRL
jgi:predicted RNase H-like HicB family nuclease